MNNPLPPIAPVEETVRPKDDALDWEGIPSGRYDLEFRPQAPVAPADHLRVFGYLILVSALASPIGLGLGMCLAPYVGRWECVVAAAVLGIILASGHELLRLGGGAAAAESVFDSRALYCLIAPLFLFLAVSMTRWLSKPSGAFLYFLAIAMPGMIAILDQIATHAVYWMSANILVDHETRVSWRKDWLGRFLAQPQLALSDEEANDPTLRSLFNAVVRARDTYASGLLWLLAAVVVPSAFVLIINAGGSATTIGLQIVVAVFFGIVATGVLRSDAYVSMLIQFWRVVLHWFFYGRDTAMPPWMFHSPCGGIWRRRLLLMAAVSLVSVAISHLAADSLWRLAFHAKPMSVSAQAANSTSREITQPTRTLTEVLCPAIPWYAIALIGIGGILIPVLIFFAAGLLLIGPIVSSYYAALEA